jgi:hypothetical protein
MEESEILEIIKAGEGTTTEFKRELNVSSDAEKREFAKDLCAMANSVSEKGYIIYGVDEDLRIVGITRKRGTDESLIQIASSRIEPPVNFDPIWFELDGLSVLALEIPKTRMRPHLVISSRDVFIRRSKVVDKAHPNEIFMMKSDLSLEEQDIEPEAGSNEYRVPVGDRLSQSFFTISGSPAQFRTCKKSGPYLDRFSPVVFDPQFDSLVPVPEFGNTRSAISFETDVTSHSMSREDLELFLKELEQCIPRVKANAGIWDSRFPVFWSLSREKDMDYGVGAESASLAIHEKGDGVLACAIHFGRFNLYKPTCLLLFYADLRPDDDYLRLDNCWLKMLTSSIPFDPKWVKEVFQVFVGINSSFNADAEITDAVMEEVSTVKWITTGKSRVRSRIYGFMGRERSSDPKYDQSLGLVVDMTPFKDVKMERDDEWHFDHYSDLYERPPTEFFDELPVEVTNPVPCWLEIQSGQGNFGRLRIRHIVIGGSGRIMSVIGCHSVGGLNLHD